MNLIKRHKRIHRKKAGAVIFLVLLLAGCVSMTPVTTGVLSTTYDQRFTDEAVNRDWAAMESLRERIAAVRPSARLRYAVTRAEGQLNFATEEYEENDRTGIAEPLLDDALRLAVTQESGYSGPVDLSLPPIPGLRKSRPELWRLTEQAKADPNLLECAGEEIARLETGLMILDHERYEVDSGLNLPGHFGPHGMLVGALASQLEERTASAACRLVLPSEETMAEAKPPAAEKAVQSVVLSASALFRFDKCGQDDLLPDGRDELDHFGARLAAQPEAWSGLVVEGHTDRLGKNAYNLNLSRCRAETVARYLVEKYKLDSGRITVRGLASTKPIVFCTGPADGKLIECLQPNRRVEIIVK